MAEEATDPDELGFGTLLVHGGRLAGGPAEDLWALDVRTRAWQRLAPAPGPPAGGAAGLCVARGRLFRLASELAHLDEVELAVDTFDDASSFGEALLTVRGDWLSLTPEHDGAGGAGPPGPAPWPGARAAACLEAIDTGGGREFLALLLGERTAGVGAADDDADADADAQAYWDDVWAFRVPAHGTTAAGVADAFFTALGRPPAAAEGAWVKVFMSPYDDEDDDAAHGPGPRACAASAPLAELEENAIVVWGGVDAAKRPLGDGWILRLG